MIGREEKEDAAAGLKRRGVMLGEFKGKVQLGKGDSIAFLLLPHRGFPSNPLKLSLSESSDFRREQCYSQSLRRG